MSNKHYRRVLEVTITGLKRSIFDKDYLIDKCNEHLAKVEEDGRQEQIPQISNTKEVYERQKSVLQVQVDAVKKELNKINGIKDQSQKEFESKFTDCKIEFGKIGLAIGFIKPRLYQKGTDEGVIKEINRLIEAYNTGMKQYEDLEKVVLEKEDD